MATTPNFGIPLIDDTMAVSPLEGLINPIATGVDNTLLDFQRSASFKASSQAVRNARFPSPVQGDRVERTDLGFEEVYLGAWNATTNPGGANPAGWYPSSGANLAAFATRTSLQSLPTSGSATTILLSSLVAPAPGFALVTNRIQLTYPGLYLATAQIEIGTNGSGQRNVSVGGTGITRLTPITNAGAPSSSIVYTAETNAYIRATAGALLEMQVTQNSGTALNGTGASLGVTYLGAPKF